MSNNDSNNFDYLTVKLFCQRYPAFTEGGMRYLIFHEKSNGLQESGVIARQGRKVLINVHKFFEWIDSQNEKGK